MPTEFRGVLPYNKDMPQNSNILKSAVLTLAALSVFLLVPLLLVGAPVVLRYLTDIAEPIERIKTRDFAEMTVATEVFDRKGRKVGEFTSEKRFFLKITEIPTHVQQAFISAEDKDFRSHIGISPSSMVRSVIANMRGMGIRQGASTITQQVARMWFLSQERTFERKIKEIVLALLMERYLSKDEILELYLNKIFLGNHSYGVEAASRNYFRKSTHEISIGEAAMLAGLPKSPSRYAPNRHPKAASERQAFVLNRLVDDNFIFENDAAQWKKFPIPVARRAESYAEKAPYFVSAVREELKSRFEFDQLPESGLKIITTLDFDLQSAADERLEQMLKRISEHAVNDFSYKSKIEGSLLTLDPETGEVLAVQGGSDFKNSQFNRALNTRRQVGGMFIPVYVSLALERGFSVASLVGDDPIGGRRYRNESGRKSLYDLVNGATAVEGAPLYVALGSGSVKEHAEKLGFNFDREDLSLALGFGEATSVELARAYSAFVNGGKSVAPSLIKRIEDVKDNVLYESPDPRQSQTRVLSEQSAFMMYHLLRDAIREGHADMARGVSDLAGGVSSATDDLHNSWFVGVMPNAVTAVWVGAERGRTRLGQDAQSVADISEMLWKDFMSAAPTSYRLPKRKVGLPEGISFSRVPASEGRVKSLPFLTGREPSGTSKNF